MPVVANGVVYNTDSGLSAPGGILDRLTQAMDARAQNDGTLRGLAPAMTATGIPLSAPSGGVLSTLLGSMGFGQQSQPQPMPATMSGGGGNVAPAPTASGTAGQPMAYAPADSSPQSGDGLIPAIAQLAQKHNLDPMTVLRAVRGESKLNPGAVGDGGSSFGLLQMHYGGMAPGGNSGPGLGDDYTQATGRDARDPKNALDALDYALGDVSKNGWGKFHAAAKAGIGTWDGVGGAPQQTAAYTSVTNSAGPRMPQATASGPQPSQAMVLANSNVPGAAGGPGQGGAPAAAQQGGLALPAGMTKEALAAMISEPETRKLGLAIWQQALSPKDDFTLSDGQGRYTHGGQVIANRGAAPDYAPQEVNGRVVSFDKRSGRATDATPAGLPQGYRPATPQERQAYNVQPDAPLFFGPDGKPTTLNSGVSQTVNTASDPIVGAVGDRFKASLDAAVAASKAIPAIRTARTQLDQGIISGAGADQRLGLQKIASQLGVPGADAGRITNTETFRAAVGPIVLSTVKGLGAGAGISNADRDFAERMAGGNIALDGTSIRRILDIQERAATATIQQHNALAQQMQRTPAGAAAYRAVGGGMQVAQPDAAPTAATGNPTGGVATVQTPDQARTLPRGTRFRTPDGREFIR